MLLVASIASLMLLTTNLTRRAAVAATSRKEKAKHCIVHVYGLHHSGTGFTRQTVYNSLGGDNLVSMHANTSVNEDEGQFLQNVYPTLGKRLDHVSLCGLSSDSMNVNTIGRLYYCPELLLSIANSKHNNLKLHQQWYWDTSKQFLLQKTPIYSFLNE